MPARTQPASRRLAATAHPPLPEVFPAGTRRSILETALRLFAERGYSGTSIRDIATACGLQGPTLYSHYPSKEHVLAEICRMGHEAFLRSVRAQLLDTRPDPREQVTAYVRAHVLFHAQFSMLAVVCNSELHMLAAELAAPILQTRKMAEEILVNVIQRGVDQGAFHVPHVWLAAAMIGGPALRVAHWYSPGFEVPAERVAEVYQTFALRILGAAPA